MLSEEQNFVRRLADYQRISGYFWIVLGVIQVVMLVTAIAGGWNIYAGFTRIKSAKLIQVRDPAIPETFESITGLVIIGIINVLLGGIIGLLLVAFDFYIRDKVLENAALFTDADQSACGQSPFSLTPVPIVAGDFDQQLRTLAKLRADGIITEEDFNKKKKEILGV